MIITNEGLTTDEWDAIVEYFTENFIEHDISDEFSYTVDDAAALAGLYDLLRARADQSTSLGTLIQSLAKANITVPDPTGQGYSLQEVRASITGLGEKKHEAPQAPTRPEVKQLVPLVLKRTATTALRQKFFVVPPEHTKITGLIHGQKLPLHNKALTNLAVEKYYGMNREDMVRNIKQEYREGLQEEYTETQSAQLAKKSRNPGYKPIDSFMPPGDYLPHWPELPGGAIPVRQESLELFCRYGKPGNAFTGLVAFAARNAGTGAPTGGEIVLFPTQATGDYLAHGALEHPPEKEDEPPEILARGTVYGFKPEKYTTHEGDAGTSHAKLSGHVERHVKETVPDLIQEGASYQKSGLAIGFTVIKGGSETADKYSFKSIGCNGMIFDVMSPMEKDTLSAREVDAERKLRLTMPQYAHGKSATDGDVPAAWGEKIVTSIEQAKEQFRD